MIKLVESNLGAPIFNRSTDPLTLTYAGEKYIEAAQKILTINANLAREIEEINDEEHGKIRLGIPVQRGMQVLPYVLPKFFQKYPHVDIVISEHGSAAIDKLVLDGSVDLAAMTTSAQARRTELHHRGAGRAGTVGKPEHGAGRRIPSGTPISILEARNEKFVSNKHGHSVRASRTSLFITNNIQPKIILETMSIEIEKKVALACDAVTICPLNYIENTEEMRARAALYPLKNTESLRHCYICHRKELYLTRYMKDFIDILLEVENPFLKDSPLPKNQAQDGCQ